MKYISLKELYAIWTSYQIPKDIRADREIEACAVEVAGGLVKVSQGFSQDLINRQDAIDMVKGWNLNQHIMNEEDALDDVDALPSPEPKIIRCKDCREFRRSVNTDITFCDRTGVEVKDDDFCSYAKKDGGGA